MVRHQKGGNVQSFVSVSEENIWLDIPHSVGSGLAGLSESAWREAWTIGLVFEEVGDIKVAIALGLQAAFAEKVVDIEESFLFLSNASISGEAEESEVKSSFLFGPLEYFFCFLV